MEYRLLEKKEWPLAKKLLSTIGQELPEYGLLSAAIDGNTIAAVHVLHPLLHGEPVVIDHAYNGKVDFIKLQMPLKRQLPKGTEFYVFAPNRKIARLAQGSKMKQLPWTIWKGIA